MMFFLKTVYIIFSYKCKTISTQKRFIKSNIRSERVQRAERYLRSLDKVKNHVIQVILISAI